MRRLMEQEVIKVHGGFDSVEEEFPSLIDDFLFFVAFGAATGGFCAFIITSLFSQSVPTLITSTTVGVFIGVGACIVIEAVLP